MKTLAHPLKIQVNAATAADLELLCHGAYAPLTGMMNRDQYLSVVDTMRLSNGQIFPLPITLAVKPRVSQYLSPGDEVEIEHENGLFAKIVVTDVFERDLLHEAKMVYGTTRPDHPGVAQLLRESPWSVGGPVTLVRPSHSPYPEVAWPEDTKRLIARRGWNTVTFFQTRNPTHRAHEHMLKLALEVTDGVVLHPLVGVTKADDVPSDVRMHVYRVLIQHYFPHDRILLGTFAAAMRYAGPREALFHGLVRKNYGATHFIVGRDAAGVGNFYGSGDARELFLQCADEMGIVPLTFDSIGYCPVCQAMASSRSCPHQNRWVSMSGTQVRTLIADGTTPPKEIMRPEVAEVLMQRHGREV